MTAFELPWRLRSQMTKIAIIGGGISGLSCAHGLTERLPDAEVVLLEGGGRPGGNIRTHREQGFTLETGPNGWLNRDPSTLALALRLGLEEGLITGCEQRRRRFILQSLF